MCVYVGEETLYLSAACTVEIHKRMTGSFLNFGVRGWVCVYSLLVGIVGWIPLFLG